VSITQQHPDPHLFLLVAFFTKKSRNVQVPSSRYPKTMSIHAQLSQEALMLLRKQERKSRILSVVIACLVIVLIAGILALFALPMLMQETPTIVTYAAELKEVEDPQPKKVVQQTQRKPSAPAPNLAKVIAADTAAPTAIPVPDVVVAEPSLQFGDDMDFGQSWGDDSMGGGGGFGSTNPGSGGLEGYLYDLKQDAKGKSLSYNPDTHFTERIIALQRANFSKSELSKYFRSPTPLYLTRLAIPDTDANRGPQLFQAEKHVQPRGWIAHYRGIIVAPKSGTYRFSGHADDYLMVALDGKARLHASWPSTQPHVSKGWKPTGPANHPTPFQNHLIYGDWVNLRAGQEVEIDIAIGERPGGMVWFYLQVEEKGVNYRETGGGRPILPLFTTAPLLPDEIDELKRQFGSYEIEFAEDKVPVFRVKR